MMSRRVVAVGMMMAVALIGLTPVVVCAMPPECPMSQAAARACCLPALPQHGMARPPCHPQTIPAVSVRHHAPSAPLLGPGALALLAASPALTAAAVVSVIPASAVPRFLLTHTFRL